MIDLKAQVPHRNPERIEVLHAGGIFVWVTCLDCGIIDTPREYQFGPMSTEYRQPQVAVPAFPFLSEPPAWRITRSADRQLGEPPG
jgi:hypothetical protein